jgi:ribosomal-protein-alanine N-acetyltransferase
VTPPLRTERLVVSLAAPADAERIVAYRLANRSHLAPWEPIRPDGYDTAETWRETLGAESPAAARFLLAAREAPAGPLLGKCDLTNIVRGAFQAAHLGFSLAADAQGRGLMREALEAVIAYGFGELNLHRLMANHLPENTRSARLLAGLGFQEEGRAPEYLLIAGTWRDHVLRSLVNRAWRSAP